MSQRDNHPATVTLIARTRRSRIHAEQELTMLQYANSLKIRIDYFRPRHAPIPAAEAFRRAVALASHRYALHASLLAITVLGTVAGVLN